MNTFGSYECTCPIGYALREDQKMCKGKAMDKRVVKTLFATLEVYCREVTVLIYVLLEFTALYLTGFCW